jgi:hypothetical protein
LLHVAKEASEEARRKGLTGRKLRRLLDGA